MYKRQGADLSGKIDFNAAVDDKYLKYIYSPEFEADVDRKLAKVYDGVYGLFASENCMDVTKEVISSFALQIEHYERLKNAHVRIRRSVLGEIKEKKDGGLYYTKQFRYMFNCVLDVKEFLTLVSDDERMKDYAYFYRQFLSFYKSLKFLRRYSQKICLAAEEDLKNLETAVDKEISDLKRYKIKTAEGEVLTYSDGIAKREELKKESVSAAGGVNTILNCFSAFYDFADVIRGERYLISIGKCESVTDILRFFYKETVKAAKAAADMTTVS